MFGKEKQLTAVEDYQLTLKIEIVKEQGAQLLARLFNYQEEHQIQSDDISDPWVLLSDDLAVTIHTRIYQVTSSAELERYAGYLEGIDRILAASDRQVV